MSTLRRVLAALFLAAALGLAAGGRADAAIKFVPTECENPAGHQPPGQQPECEGEGQTQLGENQNPAGHAPLGHN